jgi:hypothetical protein
MALSDIKKSESGRESISTLVKGWDVFIEEEGLRYYFSIFLCYEEDSDATITVVSREYCYSIAELKAEIMQVLNDLPLTATEAAKLALKRDAGHVSIEDLATLRDLPAILQEQSA